MSKHRQDPNPEKASRRRCMLMAAAEGLTQTALQDRLITEHWDRHYAGGALDEVLQKLQNAGT